MQRLWYPGAYRRRGTLVVAHPSDQAEMDLFKRDMSAPDIPAILCCT